jgi:tetratricopeptide (TPR) repeat protein
VDLQCGRYSSARVKIELALADEMSWEGLARLAYLTYVMGDIDAADDLYLRAENELTVKQMRSFAWVEARRGLMNLARGLHDRALEHYRRAESAYSGHWLVDERLAELMGVQGRFDEAIAAYRRLYETSPRPEWEHALGDLYFLSGELSSGYEWKMRALEGYLKSTSHGQVHYLHSLVDLSCEMPGQSSRATEWARRDEELRSNYLTQGALAWALYRNGESQEALEWLSKALASGAVSERLYLQAACIYAGVGDVDASAKYMRLSRAANPLPAKARCLLSSHPGLRVSHRELMTVPFVL